MPQGEGTIRCYKMRYYFYRKECSRPVFSGSPFQFTVGLFEEGGAHKVRAAGIGLLRGETNCSQSFNIYTREAGKGKLSVSVEGPSKAQLKFNDHKVRFLFLFLFFLAVLMQLLHNYWIKTPPPPQGVVHPSLGLANRIYSDSRQRSFRCLWPRLVLFINLHLFLRSFAPLIRSLFIRGLSYSYIKVLTKFRNSFSTSPEWYRRFWLIAHLACSWAAHKLDLVQRNLFDLKDIWSLPEPYFWICTWVVQTLTF